MPTHRFRQQLAKPYDADDSLFDRGSTSRVVPSAPAVTGSSPVAPTIVVKQVRFTARGSRLSQRNASPASSCRFAPTASREAPNAPPSANVACREVRAYRAQTTRKQLGSNSEVDGFRVLSRFNSSLVWHSSTDGRGRNQGQNPPKPWGVGFIPRGALAPHFANRQVGEWVSGEPRSTLNLNSDETSTRPEIMLDSAAWPD